MTFGDKLKLIREIEGWSQDDLAKKLGTSKQVISRYEKGQTTPKITVGIHYAKTLKVSADNLLDDEKELFEKQQPSKTGELSNEDMQIMKLIFSLSPEERKEAINYMQYICDKKKDT